MSGEQSGVSASYVDSAISNLRAELQSEIRGLQNWTQSEINRLEREMREVAEAIVRAIERQTVVLAGGVTATTAMVESTKRQIESDFNRTVGKLEIQTESSLQIEVGKKLADASALQSKLTAFIGDIKERFETSLAGVSVNRELYNSIFKKITDDYEDKISTIGEHILEIKSEDIAPAVEAAEVSFESLHNLPIEMDLKRLATRSEQLDETIAILKSSRLHEIVSSTEILRTNLNKYALNFNSNSSITGIYVEAIATASTVNLNIITGRSALRYKDDDAINILPSDSSLSLYDSDLIKAKVDAVIKRRKFRDLSPSEVKEMAVAVGSLNDKGLVSNVGRALFEDFLGSGSLKLMEV
jgi:hypothetical protein